MQTVEATSLPWVCHAEAAHCAALVTTGERTGPGHCVQQPSYYMLVRYNHERGATWCVFLCAVHAREVAPLAEPLDQVAAAELADRRTQSALAMAGKSYRRPTPLQTR